MCEFRSNLEDIPARQGNLAVLPSVNSYGSVIVQFIGDAAGLRYFSELLSYMADVEVDGLDMPIGERARMPLRPRFQLIGDSCSAEICRAEAKGSGQLPKCLIYPDFWVYEGDDNEEDEEDEEDDFDYSRCDSYRNIPLRDGLVSVQASIDQSNKVHISVIGDQDGLRFFSKLANYMAEVVTENQGTPLGERAHIPLSNRFRLVNESCHAELFRAEAKGGGQLPDCFIEPDYDEVNEEKGAEDS